MPFTFGEDQSPRRNTRSLDLDDSAAKAAAWVWHLHASKPGITTEGRYISKRRNSSSYDRKSTRFQQEAVSTTTSSTGAGEMKNGTPLWDCGSKLYDTFELVSFSNRLDRSLMGVVPVTPLQSQPQYNYHVDSPLHQPGGILRTLSLPRNISLQMSSKKCAGIASPNPNPNPKPNPREVMVSKSHNYDGSSDIAQKAPTMWASVGKFMKAIKKLLVLHKQVTFNVGCKQNTDVIESTTQRPLDPSNKINNNELSSKYNRVRSGSEDKFSTKDKPDRPISESSLDDALLFPKKVRSHSESIKRDDESLMHKNIRFKSESIYDDLIKHKVSRSNNESINGDLVKPMKINSSGKSLGEEVLVDNDRIKDCNLGGLNYKHLHHHHHHHHHHYLHHNFTSESARLSPETMSQICAEKSWFTN